MLWPETDTVWHRILIMSSVRSVVAFVKTKTHKRDEGLVDMKFDISSTNRSNGRGIFRSFKLYFVPHCFLMFGPKNFVYI